MLQNGDTLNSENRKYTIKNMIGRGASTIAYLAECKSNGVTTKCILKEYAPLSTEDFDKGKERFIAAGKVQNKIRQYSALSNQTPPVCKIY